MKSSVFIILVLLSFSIWPCFTQYQGKDGGVFCLIRDARAEENWKREFEEICGNTDDSMKLTRDELKTLISRCDKLKPTIESLEETPRKVYLKKLKMCRSLLVFVFEAQVDK